MTAGREPAARAVPTGDAHGGDAGSDKARQPTLCLVRHAKAASRQRWTGDDHQRPLTDRGHEQAKLLADYILGSVGHPSRILSSPAVRCRETVAPLATATGLEIVETAWLDEGWTPDDAFSRLRAMTLELDGGPNAGGAPSPGGESIAAAQTPAGGPLVAVTHGDVIWGILELLVTAGVDFGEAPDAPKGGLWIIGFRGKVPPSVSFFLPKAPA